MIYTIPKRNDPKDKKEDLKLGDIELSSLAAAGWEEKDLENLLAESPELLFKENKLLPVFQEVAYQEHPDIMALDSDGVLYIFELKRQDGTEDSLLQVIRYGQLFGRSTYDELEEMLRNQKKTPTLNLEAYHKDYFDLAAALPKSAFNNEQRFVVVTAGIDSSTLDAIEYWHEKKMPISALTYHVYKNGDEYLLEFHSFSPTPDDYAVVLSGHYFINSNVRYDANAWKHMVDNNRVSAFGGKKNTIERLQRGDKVFLYHKGTGVIGTGQVNTGVVRTDTWNGVKDDEHYVDVQWTITLDPATESSNAVTAREINQKFKTGHTFRQTRYAVPKDISKFVEEELTKRKIKK